ncbi:MAG: hypothetical protein RIR11_4368, partial [Bacteroidota bacterium]
PPHYPQRIIAIVFLTPTVLVSHAFFISVPQMAL